MYDAQLALPAQLTAEAELPMEAILQSLGTTEPIQIRHQSLPTPTENPIALGVVELLYGKKSGQLPPLTQTYRVLQYFTLDIGGRAVRVNEDRLILHTVPAAVQLVTLQRQGCPPAPRPTPPESSNNSPAVSPQLVGITWPPSHNSSRPLTKSPEVWGEPCSQADYLRGSY